LEVHPFNQQKDLVDFCLGSSVHVVTNEPFSKGLRSKNGTIKAAADRLLTTEEHLMFRWAITKGYITLIPPNIRNNVNVDLEELSKPLDTEAMTAFEDLDEGLKSSWAPNVEDDD